MAEETGPPGAAVSEEEGGEVASGASATSATADPAAQIEALEAELATAHVEREALHEQLASAQEALTVSAAHYREAVLATAPEVPPELVAGDRSRSAASPGRARRGRAGACGRAPARQRRPLSAQSPGEDSPCPQRGVVSPSG